MYDFCIQKYELDIIHVGLSSYYLSMAQNFVKGHIYLHVLQKIIYVMEIWAKIFISKILQPPSSPGN